VVADRYSLRAKLVVSVLALVTCALTVMGVASVAALRRYLVGRLDATLSDVCGQLQPELDRGDFELRYTPPATGSVNLPAPVVVESVDADGTLIDSAPRPLPAHAPVLGQAALRRSGAFVATGQGGVRWRVWVLTGPNGQHAVVAGDMSDVDSSVGQLETLMLYVGLIVLLAMALVGTWLVRASLRPLGEIERAAAAVAYGDLTRRVPERDPRTEVGRLGQAFNEMVERIERAFAAVRSSEDRMRRFIADASHELRTPLTTVRGFAELFRQRATADPEAAARMVQRIEDEAGRMGLLVEDLLLLARLDERRPLATEPVDLTVLAADAVENAHAVAPEREVLLELPGSGPLNVTGDEARLRQVIGNLVTNALTHTPPGASVTVRLSRGPGRAVLEVTDTGPGLSPDQAQRVFERFYRADPSRSRRAGGTGTGLGLSIVAAIVAAHDGTVEVDSAPGEGATFRVTIPSTVESLAEAEQASTVESTHG
jgi:two-component system, OmpR family, sensor kinase